MTSKDLKPTLGRFSRERRDSGGTYMPECTEFLPKVGQLTTKPEARCQVDLLYYEAKKLTILFTEHDIDVYIEFDVIMSMFLP